MSETTTRKTAPKTEKVEDTGYGREIDVEEEIWTKAQNDEKGVFLSVEEQIGNIKLNLSRPLELRDQEPVDHLIVRAPTTKEVQNYRSVDPDKAPASAVIKSELQFFGGCCVGIKAEDVENLHVRDWNRLCNLVTNFM